MEREEPWQNLLEEMRQVAAAAAVGRVVELRSALDGRLQKTEGFADLSPVLYPRCRQKLEGEKVKTEVDALQRH